MSSLSRTLPAALLILLIPFCTFAQSTLSDLAPEEYFDFWIGTWDLTWQDRGETEGAGSNTVERILNDHVIKENFIARTGSYSGFEGQSYSVYNSQTDTWKQTWIDNSGGYLDFTGAFEEDKRIFVREGVNQNGESIQQRMIFYDIEPDSFTWDWEISHNDGETWSHNWRIKYQRVQ